MFFEEVIEMEMDVRRQEQISHRRIRKQMERSPTPIGKENRALVREVMRDACISEREAEEYLDITANQVRALVRA